MNSYWATSLVGSTGSTANMAYVYTNASTLASANTDRYAQALKILDDAWDRLLQASNGEPDAYCAACPESVIVFTFFQAIQELAEVSQRMKPLQTMLVLQRMIDGESDLWAPAGGFAALPKQRGPESPSSSPSPCQEPGCTNTAGVQDYRMTVHGESRIVQLCDFHGAQWAQIERTRRT